LRDEGVAATSRRAFTAKKKKKKKKKKKRKKEKKKKITVSVSGFNHSHCHHIATLLSSIILTPKPHQSSFSTNYSMNL